MKKIIYSVLVLSLFLVSCSSTDENVVLTSGTLSESIKSYVTDNYPDVSIDQITTNGTIATAQLSSGEELIFTKAGSFVGYANNAAKGLSTDSLAISPDSTFTCDSIGKGDPHHQGKGGHEPTIKGGDKPGKPGKGTNGGKNGNKDQKGNFGQKHHPNYLSIDSLSVEINNYISTNYSGYSIIHANTDTICEGVVTSVLVCDSTKEPIKLNFDANGVYLMKSVRILYANVPEIVTSVIASTYSSYTPSNRCSLYTLADGSLQYKIYFKSGKQQKWVRMSDAGVVVCEK